MNNKDISRVERFRQFKHEIRGSDRFLIVALDIGKNMHHGFLGTASGKTVKGGLRVEIQEYLTAAIQNIKILVKHVKEPAPALEMQLSTEAVDQASRPKSCALLNLFNLQCSHIAEFYLTLEKILTNRPAAVIG